VVYKEKRGKGTWLLIRYAAASDATRGDIGNYREHGSCFKSPPAIVKLALLISQGLLTPVDGSNCYVGLDQDVHLSMILDTCYLSGLDLEPE
jgi:hypothetical protein